MYAYGPGVGEPSTHSFPTFQRGQSDAGLFIFYSGSHIKLPKAKPYHRTYAAVPSALQARVARRLGVSLHSSTLSRLCEENAQTIGSTNILEGFEVGCRSMRPIAGETIGISLGSRACVAWHRGCRSMRQSPWMHVSAGEDPISNLLAIEWASIIVPLF